MKYSLKCTVLLFLILFSYVQSFSQEVWDWQKCIDYALKNNIQIQQANLNVQLSESNVKAAKTIYTPNIHAGSNYNLGIGNNYNYFSNTYEKQSVHYQDYSLNISQPIFDGLQTVRNVKKSQLDLQALRFDKEVVESNIQLQILSAFLNIMNANEQYEQAQKQHTITTEQFERTTELIKAGAAAESSIVDVEAQLSSENLTIAQIKNQLELANLDLKTILQLDAKTDFKVEIPQLPADFSITDLTDVQTVYAAALALRPEIKSANYKSLSAQRQIKVAKTGYIPTLNFVGNINTFFTTQSKLNNIISTGNFVPSGAFVEGTFQQVLMPETKTEIKKNPYKNQLNQNLSYAFGLSLTVPIFNKYQTQTAVKQSKLQYQLALLSENQASIDLFNKIQKAYLNATAAMDNYTAANVNFTTAKKSYDFANERFNLGSVNQLQLNMAKSNFDVAISKLTQSKYEYLFYSKLLDFYQGKSISF